MMPNTIQEEYGLLYPQETPDGYVTTEQSTKLTEIGFIPLLLCAAR